MAARYGPPSDPVAILTSLQIATHGERCKGVEAARVNTV